MPSPLLAYRPASVVDRLGARSEACPLATRELLLAAVELGRILPVVQAPIAAVARAALVAARELDAALGLALPVDVPPEPWFAAVARAADEVAAGLPIFLSGEVVVPGEGATQVERAARDAWRLVEAGLTHLAVDAAAVAPEERGRVVADVAQAAFEHGASLDVVVPLAEGAQAGPRAAAILDELAARGTPADVASVRCPAPADDDEARVQAAALARIAQALSGVPLMRRGGTTPRLVELLLRSPVKLCDDGGAAGARALGLVPFDLVASPGEGEETRASPLERAVAELSDETADRLEARAYVDAIDFLERLGARGSASEIGAVLRRRLEER